MLKCAKGKRGKLSASNLRRSRSYLLVIPSGPPRNGDIERVLNLNGESRRGVDWNRRASQQSKCDWWKRRWCSTHNKSAQKRTPSQSLGPPGSLGILINSGPPVTPWSVQNCDTQHRRNVSTAGSDRK